MYEQRVFKQAIEELRTCKSEEMEKGYKIKLYELIALSYIGLNYPQGAKNSISDLRQLDPYYEAPANAPAEYKKMLGPPKSKNEELSNEINNLRERNRNLQIDFQLNLRLLEAQSDSTINDLRDRLDAESSLRSSEVINLSADIVNLGAQILYLKRLTKALEAALVPTSISLVQPPPEVISPPRPSWIPRGIAAAAITGTIVYFISRGSRADLPEPPPFPDR